MVASLLISVATLFASTPKLNIKLKNGTPLEQQKLAQIERLAQKYDLAKYTLTRDIVIEERAVAHSYPVLTLNGRFLNNDDLALSQYVHEQAHWVLMEHHRADMPRLYRDLKQRFPDLPVAPPKGDGLERSTYFHLAVIMLEWQAMEDIVGPERARRVLEWKQGDHYTAIYAAVLEHRAEVETILQRYAIRF
jgi:hypothetical protein